jgi:hypothetical protein
MVEASRDQRGVLHVPLALVLVASTVAALGCIGILRHWHHLAEIQLRLDACVGKAASELRSELRAIESDNHRMEALRISIAVASLEPHAREALKAALKAIFLHQEYLLIRWKTRQGRWILENGCAQGDLPVPLPAMAWHRPLPDTLGPKPLSWQSGVPKSLAIRDSRSPRFAAARVYFEERKGHAWKMEWRPFGAGLP